MRDDQSGGGYLFHRSLRAGGGLHAECPDDIGAGACA
jgi:hypothetical protein